MENEIITAMEIQKAMENNEFILYYQPYYHLVENKMAGAEVLARWEHKNRGLLSPARFIPIAEEGKQIYELDIIVFTTALKQMKKWEAKKINQDLSINLSSKTLINDMYFDKLEELLISSGVDARLLTIEITETILLKDLAIAAEKISRIREMGLKVALDDFGTGYSSLAHLNQFIIDTIKIDKSFVKFLPQNKKAGCIIKNLVTMAHDLNCNVVAEGIETEEQFELLKEMKCDQGQGYFMCKPISVEDFEKKYMNTQKTCSRKNERGIYKGNKIV